MIASQLERVIEHYSRMTSRGEQMVLYLDTRSDESKSPIAGPLLNALVQKGREALAEGVPSQNLCEPYLDEGRFEKAKEAVIAAHQHLDEIRKEQRLDDEGRQAGLSAVEDLDAAFNLMADCFRELQSRVVEQLGSGPSQTPKQVGTQLRNQRIKDIAKALPAADRKPAKVLRLTEEDTEMQAILKSYKEHNVKLSRDIVKKQLEQL